MAASRTTVPYVCAALHRVWYSCCRSVFEKGCYCIPLKFEKSTNFWWYAIAVFFFKKSASISRVPERECDSKYSAVLYQHFKAICCPVAGKIQALELSSWWCLTGIEGYDTCMRAFAQLDFEGPGGCFGDVCRSFCYRWFRLSERWSAILF